MSDSTKLLAGVKKLHAIACQTYVDGDFAKAEMHKGMKQLCKGYYLDNKKEKIKGMNEKNSTLHYETCLWGHIHNLNRAKAIKALWTYETLVSATIDGVLFDGETINMVQKTGNNPSVQMRNEEGFRLSCEYTKNMIQVFKLLIEMI